MVLKPDAWRLFRHIPSDYVRNIKTMGYGSLAIEGTGNALSVKQLKQLTIANNANQITLSVIQIITSLLILRS
ncbi:DUF4225 domain-containing protein [Yersinia enterocolitica]|uniref:DUF4225 domain-containing protein n=1 Tax=Yersinia enterocolitica TaxID=630 RepID=UPI0022B67D7F|nr:DUF4225 domain-containing protein [Yersinia enterocolitica]